MRQKREEMKPVLKAILISSSVVLLLMGSFFLVAWMDSKEDSSDSEGFIDETKFPLTGYLYKESPKEEKITIEAKKEEPKDTLAELSTLKETISKKTTAYTMDIFPRDDGEARLKEQKRQSMLAQRLGAPIQINPPINQFTPEQKEIDYGANRFSNYDKQDLASNEHRLLRTITADRMMPAILITPITSDLPGQVTALIEDDIFAAMGRANLVPKGSRAIGIYGSNNKLGENRLQIVWTRIITPQGVNILLTQAQAADVTGMSGALGELDNKYWDRYGLALSLSTVANAILLTVANQTQKFPNDHQTTTLLDKSGNDISTIMNNIIKEQTKIAPTITISAGSRIFINPTVDIWVPIPKDNEVLVQYFTEYKEFKK